MKMPSDFLPDEPPAAETDSFLPSADKVREGMLKLQASAEQIETTLWFLGYAIEFRDAKNRGDLARLIGLSSTTVSRIFSGAYEGSLETFVAKVRKFRGGAGVRKRNWPVADLRIGREIGDFCEAVRGVQQIGFIWGPNQSGKSYSLELVASGHAGRRVKGRTFYIFTPAGASTREFMVTMAAACGFSVQANYLDICEAAKGFFQPGDLVIIDEYHQTLISRVLKTVTIEKIKEIYEATGCSMVLCGTDVMPQKMNDPKLKPFLGQTANRGALRMKVPIAPYKSDLQAAFAAYGLPRLGPGEVRDKVDEIASAHGLGRIFRYLQLATKLAKGKGRPAPTHEDFMVTVRTVDKWVEGKNPNDKWEDAE